MPAKRRSYHHGDLHNALVAEAARVIQERGSVDFTLRDVAAAVKVSHTAAYRHFESKTAILAAVAQRGFELLDAALVAADAQAKTRPLERLAREGVAYVDFAARNPGYFRAMFHADLRDKSALPGLAGISQAAYGRLAATVEACVAAGAFPARGAEVTVKSWAVVHGLAFLVIDGQWPEDGPVAPDDEPALARLARRVGALLKGEC